jgi:hypothetical protein
MKKTVKCNKKISGECTFTCVDHSCSHVKTIRCNLKCEMHKNAKCVEVDK